jgi:twinkle protein
MISFAQTVTEVSVPSPLDLKPETREKPTTVHAPCHCGKSSDALAIYPSHDFCFSCGKYFGKDGEVKDEEYTYEYIPQWGVSRETMRLYDVRTRVSESGPVSVGAPFDNGALQIRQLSSKHFTWKEGDNGGKPNEARLFGVDRFSPGGDVITIYEGWKDALSGYELTRSPSVSIRSSVTAATDVKAHWDFINSFKKIIICCDNDDPGRKATEAIARLFEFDKVKHAKLTKKDCNDYLTSGDRDGFVKAWRGAGRFLPDDIYSTREAFRKIILESKDKTGVPYPFTTLTECTRGLRTGELVLVSGGEGLGKTEIVRAIEYHILKNTDWRIGTIHLEEPKDRQLKGMAGYELNAPAHYEDVSATKNEIADALDLILGTKEPDERLNLYSHFDSSDPDIIIDRVRFMVSVLGCKLVTIDVLSKLTSALTEEDERRKIDYIVTKLDQMTRDLDFALIITAHENNQGNIRGSTYPSKTASVWLHIDRDLTAEDEHIRNRSYLTLKKNRFGQKTGPAGFLSFNPETFKITEEIGLPV